jgi:hypothetical protein
VLERSTAAPCPEAELWGDEQWQVLKAEIEKQNPKSIAIDVSRVFAFNDGLSAGELEGMSEALGPKWTSRFTHANDLALDLIATRLPEESETYRKMQQVVWGIIDTAFSSAVIKPGVTHTEDVVWWMRQKVNDLGLGTWFHPSIELQATTPVPEWNNQPVHSAQEEDAIVGPDGVSRWALARQTEFHLVGTRRPRVTP